MTRRTRRTIFYALVCLFFVLGTAVVLYAQGWRLDLRTWHAEKVGAVFVRSFPVDAAITLDGTPVQNRSGFISRGTLISDLFPKKYDLVLSKDGYVDWHENAWVLPSLVTEFKYAVLVPKAQTVVATATIKNFSIASGETILQTANNGISWRGQTVGHGEVASESTNFKNIIIKNIPAGTYSLYDFASGLSTNLSTLFANNGIDAGNITEITIDPYDATKVIAETDRRVWIFDEGKGTVAVIERGPGVATIGASLAVSPSLIAWTRSSAANGASAVVLYDKFSGAITASSSTIPGKTSSIQWVNGNLLGILQANGALYLYDTEAHEFKKLADDVKNFETAGDGSAIAALEHASLEILPLTGDVTYRRFNLPAVASASRIVWYGDSDHLFVQYPDHVSFLDLEDLGLRNFTTVAEGTSLFYEPKEGALYLVGADQKLVRFDFPR